MTITIKVIDKRANVIGTPIIVCGNSGYTINFDFDAEWDAHVMKTARFVYAKGGELKYQDVVFSGNTADVPILSNVREVYVGVFAGELRTTTPARVPCDKSILCGGGVHEDPPEDVYNQILALCDELTGASVAHLYDKSNPHGVTAAQVGARPDTWMPTAAQIGAAPSGYGLGDIAYNLPEVTDADTATANGWYLLGKEATNGVGCKAVMRVDAYSPSALIQTVYTTQYSNYYPLIQQRTCFNGPWGAWEWQNPPMLEGEEYRTTERWNGKAVYTKLVSLGTTVEQNSFTIPIETTISNLIRFVPNLDNKVCSDWAVYGATNAGGAPNVGNAFYCLVQRISSSAVDAYVVCGSLRTGKSLSMQIWYTVD